MNEEDYEEVDAGDEESPEVESRQDSISEIPSDNAPSTVKTEPLRQPAAPQIPAAEPVQVIVAPPVPVLSPESQPAVRVRDIERERPQLGSRQRKNEFEPYSNGDITNISQYTEEFMDGPVKQESSFMKLDGPDEANGLDLSKAVPYDENSFAGPSWFSMTEVSDAEKVALPEYFKSQGKKAERLAKEYKKYRNFMIEAYRKNPSYYLTFTACKNALNIDMLAIIRIHTFLEHAGLINQLVDPRRRLFDPFIDSEPDAEVRTKGTQRDFAINEPDIQFLRNLIYEEIPKAPEQSAWDVKVYDDLNVDGRSVFSCTSCHQDCTEIRYHSLKYKGLQLCVNCFLEGKFTATTWKGEFLRVDKNDREVPEDTWSEDEVLRLLEAIDHFDDDWLAISEHVGTRTKEQCITQFLQLPINDEFLTAKLSDKELEELPFGDQSNPVMTLIAFLSGHLNPGIASFAAKRAIKELMDTTQDDPMDVDDESDYDDDEDEEDRSAFSRAKVKRATIGALESAVEHAKKLASYEHEEIQHWTRLVVKTLVDKLVIKIQQYDEQEIFLENELKELEKQGVALNTSLEALSKQYPPNSVFGNASTTPAATSTTTTPTIKQ
ncbi:SWIRM domain-containing protein [Fennellomyces sp. T-0311]|nr:SWIRM domain-containing protein [Fennellomyces sp. T-0311]